MKTLREDLGLIERRGWLIIALVAAGNVAFVFTGVAGGSATYALVVLAVLGFAWVVLLQVTRGIMNRGLELAQESTANWQRELDLSQELCTEYIDVINDLKRFDVQRSGVHLSRLRATLVKRHPDLEEVIPDIEHALNDPGIVI